MESFLADPNKQAIANGTIFVTTTTTSDDSLLSDSLDDGYDDNNEDDDSNTDIDESNIKREEVVDWRRRSRRSAGFVPEGGAATLNGSYIRIFDGGVHDGGRMYMHYFLLFLDSSGSPWHLEGTKYVFGNDCIAIEKEVTTLYSAVRSGWTLGQGDYYLTGVLEIDPEKVVALLASLRMSSSDPKNVTDADYFAAVLSFAEYLVQDIKEDCWNFTAYESRFWYVWASNGEVGFLLDLIQRPDTLELRLDLYNNTPGASQTVLKQYFPLSELNFTDPFDPFRVTMGSVSLDGHRCFGSVDGVSLDVSFALSMDEHNVFVPRQAFPFIYLSRSVYIDISFECSLILLLQQLS